MRNLMTENFDFAPEPTSIGFLSRDEEIRVAALTAAATANATGEYKPSATSIVTTAKRFEQYIRDGN
jgi:hypothetical protein